MLSCLLKPLRSQDALELFVHPDELRTKVKVDTYVKLDSTDEVIDLRVLYNQIATRTSADSEALTTERNVWLLYRGELIQGGWYKRCETEEAACPTLRLRSDFVLVAWEAYAL